MQGWFGGETSVQTLGLGWLLTWVSVTSLNNTFGWIYFDELMGNVLHLKSPHYCTSGLAYHVTINAQWLHLNLWFYCVLCTFRSGVFVYTFNNEI